MPATIPCIHCKAPLGGSTYEVHEDCLGRLEQLWDLIKDTASSEKNWKWDSDDLWPAVSDILYGTMDSKIYKVTRKANGELAYDEVTDEFNVLKRVVADQQQANYYLQSRLQQTEQYAQQAIAAAQAQLAHLQSVQTLQNAPVQQSSTPSVPEPQEEEITDENEEEADDDTTEIN